MDMMIYLSDMWQIFSKTFNHFISKLLTRLIIQIWKKSNIIPVYYIRKTTNRIYNFLLNVRLLNPTQSDFRPSDFCLNKLPAITHEIFQSFHCNPSLRVRSIFLDIPKAFNKVWI